MSTYSGAISFYFPCKIKQSYSIKSINRMWNKWRRRQVWRVHSGKIPLTSLMDERFNRDENEYILSLLQSRIPYPHNAINPASPYATSCLKKAYRKNREDNLFAKNASLALSKFRMEYVYKKTLKKIVTDGALIFNVNADNSVATLIVVLNFSDFSAEDVIMLKHILYKRLSVKIKEYKRSGSFTCSDSCSFNCISRTLTDERLYSQTLQDYANHLSPLLSEGAQRLFDVDFRARYSFIELTEDVPHVPENEAEWRDEKILKYVAELYGMLMGDEGYEYVSGSTLKETFSKNYSTRNSYSFYMAGLNAMIVTHNMKERKKCKKHHGKFEREYMEPFSHVQTEPIGTSCIPGVEEEYFPSCLKATEIHYLINKVMTNEIETHDRSYINPWIFLRRLSVLWEILYELDVHKYHVKEMFMDSFGINRTINSIQKEYDSIVAHSMSFFAGVLAILTLIFTMLQIWK